MEACVRSLLLYGKSAWDPKEREIKKLESCWFECFVKGGWKRHESPEGSENDFRFVYTNLDLQCILRTTPLRDEIIAQKMRYFGHICRRDNKSLTKKMLFAKSKRPYYRDPVKKLASKNGIEINQLLKMTQSQQQYKGFIEQMRSASERRVR